MQSANNHDGRGGQTMPPPAETKTGQTAATPFNKDKESPTNNIKIWARVEQQYNTGAAHVNQVDKRGTI